jgi:hypothetical protein
MSITQKSKFKKKSGQKSLKSSLNTSGTFLIFYFRCFFVKRPFYVGPAHMEKQRTGKTAAGPNQKNYTCFPGVQ